MQPRKPSRDPAAKCPGSLGPLPENLAETRLGRTDMHISRRPYELLHVKFQFRNEYAMSVQLIENK